MKFSVEVNSLLLLFATVVVVPSSGQQRVVPQLYGAIEVPTQGADCPAAADTEVARNTIRSETQSILQDNVVPVLDCPLGACQANPADSCDAIYQWNPSSPSDWYWLQKCDGELVQVYCAIGNPCGCSDGGWRRIAFLDMNDMNMQCPHGLDLLASPVRTCERRHFNEGYVSVFYPSLNMPYSQVCGRIVGYQIASPDAFAPYINNQAYTIDDPYVDGVMLTYGYSPRKHIWTFAAGVDDQGTGNPRCPCSRSDLTWPGPLPPFIGNDWFCETAFVGVGWSNTFQESNPLWDGQGCGAQSTCCTMNNSPWFCKTLTQNTTDFIELRFNGDQNLDDENLPINLYEIYVR